ncbi:MAG: hypothetical protein L3J71_03525 [Victivallaceae bacterium]|nr:hypothetical protein [Victivallaceae bacterium]
MGFAAYQINPDANLAKIVGTLKHPDVFLKIWTATVAKKARSTARRKGGHRWWSDLSAKTRIKKISFLSSEISNDHVGANLKQYGGTVRPKRGKFLAIPSRHNPNKQLWPSEYGKGELFFIRRGRRGFLLKKDGKRITLMFILVTKTVHKPDPWFPSDRECRAIGTKTANKYLKTEARKFAN